MAFTQDAWFNDTYIKALSNTIALDLSNTTAGTYKGALFTGTVVPLFSQTNPAYGSSPWNANEASGAGYTAGGLNLTVASFGELTATNKVGWRFNTFTWTSSTITAEGLLVYAPGLSNRAVIFRWLTQSYTTNAGDFSVACQAEGGAWRTVLRNT